MLGISLEVSPLSLNKTDSPPQGFESKIIVKGDETGVCEVEVTRRSIT